MPGPDIFISAGEASGEHYGALLLSSLKRRLESQGRQPTFFGMGGPRMAAEGLEMIVRSEDMAVMGITEVVRHLPRIYREFRRLKQTLRARRPDIAILIDFPDIHFKLAEQLHSAGVPVIFFVSPQLWAWKKRRIRLVRKYVDKMLVIFPFEEQFYRSQGVNAEFVGHPLADLPSPSITRQEFAAHHQVDPAKSWIALLPGSRAKEIRDNLPEMLAAARLLAAGSRPTRGEATGFSPEINPASKAGSLAPEGLEFIVPLAPTLNSSQRAFVARLVAQQGAGLPIHLISDMRARGAVGRTAGAVDALFHARASIVASGTATVEAALIGNPFVVVYRVSPLTYAIAKRVVKVPHVAMANLIAGSRVVPELIQNNFTARNIVQHIAPLLPDGVPRESMMKELVGIRNLLSFRNQTSGGTSRDAIDRVADIVLDRLGLPSGAAVSVPS